MKPSLRHDICVSFDRQDVRFCPLVAASTPIPKAFVMSNTIRRNSGFTLIELMIVTVIVGIIASMAVPKFQRAYERMQFTASHRRMISTFRTARSMAITEKMPYGVHVDQDKMLVTLFKDVASGVFEYSVGADSVIRVDSLPAHIVYLSSDNEGGVIIFQPNGSASFAGGGNIFAMANSPDIMGIFMTNVLSSTGRIKSESYHY